MTETHQCPECGAELTVDAPRGLCPACLLKQGFESSPAENLAETAAPASRFTALTSEELARRFPQLEILELLGQGGMGAVYKARQPSLDRLVAIKILPIDAGRDPAFAERFTREARALARLSHPHIVGIYDFGQADGLYYFVMEYVDGVNLRQLVASRQLSPQQALALVPQICEALQFAHDEGIVHRDVKPENILLDKRGRVKIADFGLAKLLGRTAGEATLTRVEQVMGTPLYMAPEQMQSSHAVDHRADIYSLGVVFYEMLTGELPLGRFAPPSQKVHVDVRLDEIVLRTLEREPDRRYQHASDVKTEVESISAGAPTIAGPRSASSEATLCRNQVRGPAIGLLVTGVLGCTWTALFLMGAIADALDMAMSTAPAPVGTPWRAAPSLTVLVATFLVGSACTMFGALKMMRCQAYRLALLGSVLAMLIIPGNIVGLPVGVWALAVLTQPEVRRAFRRGGGSNETSGQGAWLDAAQEETIVRANTANGPRSFRSFQLLAVAGFALMLVSGLLFVAGSPTINVMPRNSANFFGIAVACAGMLVWIIAAAIGQTTQESEAECVAVKPAPVAEASVVHADGTAGRQSASVRAVSLLTALACLFGVATAFQPWAEVSMATFNKPPASAVGFAWWQGMVVAFSFTAMALLLLATVVAARFPRWRPVVVVVGALAVAAADASFLTEFSRGDLPVEPLLTAAKWGIEIDGKTPQTIREAKVVATRREGPYWVLSTAAAVLVLTAVESGLALWQANRRSPSRPGVLNRR